MTGCPVHIILRDMNTNYSVCDQDTGLVLSTSSLYDACKAIVGAPTRNVFRDGKLVAHWFDGVRAGFGATDIERKQITTDAGVLT